MDDRVDEVDRRILYALAGDARGTSAPMIAEQVDVSPGTIRNRIDQLETAGIIRGYHADIDYERVEGRLTNLFVCTAPVADRERLANQALNLSGVVNVRQLTAGQRNLHVTVVGGGSRELTRIATQLSELGLTIEEERLVEQEVTQPYEPFGPNGDREFPSLNDFISLTGDAEIVELTASVGAPILGMTLEEAKRDGVLPDETLVVGIERGDNVVTPKGETRIQAGDIITLFSREPSSGETIAAFGGE
ncbi:Lrp/AsnC family transcriptional regulator [Haloglomus halophilum]|uniref:Lrp/AsnC family transcriptional regulator n=1 Tax=Haloglomus halophilum TaxID=2962672 RepID=UPI0020C9A49A|nr:TrkA C-terminal domain-containing protein [Haloglomus halophilum]